MGVLPRARLAARGGRRRGNRGLRSRDSVLHKLNTDVYVDPGAEGEGPARRRNGCEICKAVVISIYIFV